MTSEVVRSLSVHGFVSSCMANSRLSSCSMVDKNSSSSELEGGGILAAILGQPRPTKADLSLENSETGILRGNVAAARRLTLSDCCRVVRTVFTKNSLVERRECDLLWSTEVSQASISRSPLIVAGSSSSQERMGKPWTVRTCPRNVLRSSDRASTKSSA